MSSAFDSIFPYQKIELIKNIEKLTFWPGDNEKLHFAKQELLSQINNLSISINGKGLFNIDRHFLAGVNYAMAICLIKSIEFENILTFRWLQLVAHTLSFSFSFIWVKNKSHSASCLTQQIIFDTAVVCI